eukprot:7519835-Pyramimonas_sp.AAC.1
MFAIVVSPTLRIAPLRALSVICVLSGQPPHTPPSYFSGLMDRDATRTFRHPPPPVVLPHGCPGC